MIIARPSLDTPNPHARNPSFNDPAHLVWRPPYDASCPYCFVGDTYGAFGLLTIVLCVWCGWQDVEGDSERELAMGWGLGRYSGDDGRSVVWCRAYTLGLVSRDLFR